MDPFGLSLKSRGTHYTIAGLPYKEWQLDLHEQKREESQEVNYSSEFSGGGDDADQHKGDEGPSLEQDAATKEDTLFAADEGRGEGWRRGTKGEGAEAQAEAGEEEMQI